MKNHFEIVVASVPEKEKLVAEIWYKNIFIAEINQDESVLTIELYEHKDVAIPIAEFQEVLEKAKQKLLG